MRPLLQHHPQALPPAEVAALREGLLRTGLLGASQLKGTFSGSRGFGVAFRADARARVLERFGVLAPFFSLLDRGAPTRHLRPLTRLRAREPNAFYLNLLVVGDGGGVGRHVDGTLQDPVGVPGAVPEVVTALYLQVPQGSGGELRLFRGDFEVGHVVPAEGDLVHFRGDLAHDVAPLHGAATTRMSLICEQYTFAPEVLSRLPPLTVQSRAPDAVFAPAPTLAGDGAFAARLRRPLARADAAHRPEPEITQPDGDTDGGPTS